MLRDIDKNTASTGTIYQRLLEAGIETDHYESDLYALATPAARAIVADYEHRQNVKTFVAQSPDGRLWFDIPFAFDPYWASRACEE